MQPFDFSQLDTLFAPRSIAVVGASEQTSKIGGIPLDYLLRFGYDGQLHAVNPRTRSVQGLPAHESLRAIGAPMARRLSCAGRPWTLRVRGFTACSWPS